VFIIVLGVYFFISWLRQQKRKYDGNVLLEAKFLNYLFILQTDKGELW